MDYDDGRIVKHECDKDEFEEDYEDDGEVGSTETETDDDQNEDDSN